MQHLQPNTTLQGGKYRIERVLGQGGFGITYMATQVSLQRKVAIKELFLGGSGQAINDRRGNEVVVTNSANQASFDQHKTKFKKEALRLANLNHPNLVKVHDFFEENGTVYYVMDYIDGESLRTKWNREGCLSEELVINYMQQILPALDAAHKQNIWHLDIKPENIMVDRNGHAYLIDFGASKHVEPNSTLTTSLALAYTPGYCPPELLDLSNESLEYYIQAIKDIGPWTDIYALGATMYNLLSDSIPPSKRRLDKEGRNAFMFPSNISSSTKDLIVWMMKPNSEDRPQSVDEIYVFLVNNNKSDIPVTNMNQGGKIDEERTEVVINSKLDEDKTLKTSPVSFKKNVVCKNGLYEGELRGDVPFGRGKMHLNDHSIYVGEWKNGVMEGNGSMIWPSGKKYEGEWRQNKPNGNGIMLYPNGVKYEGKFKDGEKHGYGILTQPNGEEYRGEFSEGKITGEGIYYDKKGKKRIISEKKYDFLWVISASLCFIIGPVVFLLIKNSDYRYFAFLVFWVLGIILFIKYIKHTKR